MNRSDPSPSFGHFPARGKRQALVQLLRDRIMLMSPGQRLPSVRGIMRRYHLSMQTVTGAIEELVAENLIEARIGSGMYVSDSRTQITVVLHRIVYPSYGLDMLELAIQKAMNARHWCFISRSHNQYADRQPALHPEPPASAHLLTREVAALRPDVLHDVLAQQVPTAVLDRQLPADLPVDAIISDDTQRARLLVQHLVELGHSRFLSIANEPFYPEQDDPRQVFYRLLDEMNVPRGLMLDCQTQPGQPSGEMAYRALDQFLRELGDQPLPFSAILVASEAGARCVLRLLHERGVRVPGQCSVACFSNSPELEWTIPSLTGVGVTTDQLAEASMAWLDLRLRRRNRARSDLVVAAQLAVRESTGRCPGAAVRLRRSRRRR